MNKNERTKKKTSKQIVAILGIVLLAAMYVATLLAAIFDTSGAGTMFRICLSATFAIPLLLWIYIWLYGKITGKHTMADAPEDKE